MADAAQNVLRTSMELAKVGPLIVSSARDDVHALVTTAVAAGAVAVTGGAIFGPVAPVTTFSSEADAIKLANASEYGLASYPYSRDFKKLLRVAEQIEFGMSDSTPASSPTPQPPSAG